MMAHAHVERHDRPLAFFVAGFLGVLAVVYAGCIAEARISPAAISPGAGQNTIAVVTRNGGSPCGICRQMLYEFAPGLKVIVANRDGEVLYEHALSDLLPYGFGPVDLNP